VALESVWQGVGTILEHHKLLVNAQRWGFWSD